jgi:hypothetical protein
MFAHSQVVVGYHGAGLANALFCPSDASFYDMDASKMWRSNERIKPYHGSLTWLKHTIDVDRLTPLPKLANNSDVDHYIKDLRDVEVTGSTLYNSIETVKKELAKR